MRRAVLAALLALTLSSEHALATEIETAPDDFLADQSALPEGYELRADLTTRNGSGEVVERVYTNDRAETTMRLIAVAVPSEAEARAACITAGEPLRPDDYDVQPAMVDGMPGIVAERRMGLSYQRAAYVVSGSACLGVMTLGQEDSAVEGSEATILHAMVAKVRAA